MKKKGYLLLGFYLLFFTIVKAENEFENFETKVITTFTLSEKDEIKVNHQFNLKNKNHLVFLKKYQLFLSTDQISMVQLESSHEAELKTNQKEQQTFFDIEFKEPLVGEGKDNKFTLNYRDISASYKKGLILDLFLTNLSFNNNFDSYQVIVKIPKKYGLPKLSSLTPTKQFFADDYLVLTFDNLKDKIIFLSFGNKQIFDFRFSTLLDNNSSYKNTLSLAIPADGIKQKVFYQEISPKPQIFTTDEDGNWLISYVLKPFAQVKVNLIGQVLIQYDYNFDYLDSLVNQENYLHALIKSQMFWESNDTEILSLGKFLESPEKIYQYVTSNLNYKDKQNQRLGAVKSLEKKEQATCQEFSDLTISLLRSQQVPSRRVVGFALDRKRISDNLFLGNLHSWVEYYYQNQWFVFDPTFGKNLNYYDYFNDFDLNHFNFVINGLNSYQPASIGEEFLSNNKDNLAISFGQEVKSIDSIKEKIKVKFDKKNVFNFSFPFYQLTIQNLSGEAIYKVSLNLNYDLAQFSSDNAQQTNFTLLPFEKKVLPIKVYNKNSDINSTQIDLNYSLLVNQETIIHETVKLATASRFLQFIKPRWLLLLAFTIFLSTVFAGSLLVFRKKRKNSLRWKSKKSSK